MNVDQKYTPKYWVGHNKASDDVYLCTANKSKLDELYAMEDMFGEDWFMDEDFEVILVEIKMVENK